jgi:hypothetical protein
MGEKAGRLVQVRLTLITAREDAGSRKFGKLKEALPTCQNKRSMIYPQLACQNEGSKISRRSRSFTDDHPRTASHPHPEQRNFEALKILH